MKVGIIQSNFIPWRGYFDFIDDVDLFIYHDDIQYTKGDWRNRNKIKTESGTMWLTVPVNYKSTSQRIHETTIDYSTKWINKFGTTIKQNYKMAHYFYDYYDEIMSIINMRYTTISELNINLNSWILEKLHIKTKTKMSSELTPVGTKTDRLIDILEKVKATSYLSGPMAKNYLDITRFSDHKIKLYFKSYSYDDYNQLHGSFEPNVTVLDLLFNCGDTSNKFLKSKLKNEREI